MSQARLPRTEPSTELITAHKVNHRAAHVAGRALGIFAKVRSHRVMETLVETQDFPRHRRLLHPCLRALLVNRTASSSPPCLERLHALHRRSLPTRRLLRPGFDTRLSLIAQGAHGHVLFAARRPGRAPGPARRHRQRSMLQRAIALASPLVARALLFVTMAR